MKKILLICLLIIFLKVKTNSVNKLTIDGYHTISPSSSSSSSSSCSKKICNGDCGGRLDGCCRYVKGYDVSGDEELKVIIHGIYSDCDCIDQCYLNRDKCASYAWKWEPKVCSTHRICILYKNSLAPPSVWGGSVAPICRKLNGQEDSNCTTGPMYMLQGGQVKC